MSNSLTYYNQACKYIPGGVNSPVRAFHGVGGTPIFIKKGHGAIVESIDGKQYIDYVGSWGPMILGHSHPEVIQQVQSAVANGLSFGAPCPMEVEIAEMICNKITSIDQIRMVNSGTEATMSAIRLARGYTGRNKIIKFIGCYHGHADGLLVKAGSGGLTFGTPDSAGVPIDYAKHTLLANYNDLTEVETLLQNHGDDVAAIIVEPVACNMGTVLPNPNFLPGLRQLCNDYQCLLIFDEVITGFRLGFTGAQGYYNILPDLTTFGKIIGGGMPVGAFGGRADIMAKLSPNGPVYQAGTLSGNPIAMTAGLTQLRLIQQPDFYAILQKTTTELTNGLKQIAKTHHINLCINQVESLFSLFFTNETKVDNYAKVIAADVNRYQQFFHGMLAEGISFAPSAFESAFVSSAHGVAEVTATLTAAEKVMSAMVKNSNKESITA